MRASRVVVGGPAPGQGREAGRGEAHAGDEEIGQRGTADVRGVEHGQVEGERGGQLGGRHQARDERLAGGVVEGGGRGQEGVGTVEDGQALVAGEGQGREGQGAGQHGRLGQEHHPPAVVAVGGHPTEQREHDDRQHAREAEGAEGQRGAGENVDVPVERHRLHLRAGERDELRQPEEPEVAVPEDQ